MPPGPRSGETARVALFADAPVSAEVRNQVISLCRRRNASLLVLAPRGQAVATTVVEALLPALEQAGIDWDIAPLTGDSVQAAQDYLATHPELAVVTCDGHSGLAQAIFDGRDTRHMLPMPLLINFTMEPGTRICRHGSFPEVDWLRPDLNRGI